MVVGKYFDSGPASKIAPGIWQGGFPEDPEAVQRAGFSLIVLCAGRDPRELFQLQPPDGYFPGVEMVRAPMDDADDGPTPEEVRVATAAANKVLLALREGKHSLITCAAGRNRSGLVSALALVARYGISGEEAMKIVQQKRPKALTNEGFCKFLMKVPGPKRARVL